MLLLVYTYILLLCEALLHLKEKMDASIAVDNQTHQVKCGIYHPCDLNRSKKNDAETFLAF
jgi:hypothetical protein